MSRWDNHPDPEVRALAASREIAEAEERGRVEALRTAPRCTNCGGCMSPKAAAGRRRDIEEAEERGARWMQAAIRNTLHDREAFRACRRWLSDGGKRAANWDDPAEVCRTARKEGTR